MAEPFLNGARLRAHAYLLLDSVKEPPAVPVRLRLRDGDREVRLCLAGRAWFRQRRLQRIPGQHLSPAELEVWEALAAGPLIGKQLAKRLGKAYAPVFRALLANLVKRRVLIHDPAGRGYMQAERIPC